MKDEKMKDKNSVYKSQTKTFKPGFICGNVEISKRGKSIAWGFIYDINFSQRETHNNGNGSYNWIRR